MPRLRTAHPHALPARRSRSFSRTIASTTRRTARWTSSASTSRRWGPIGSPAQHWPCLLKHAGPWSLTCSDRHARFCGSLPSSLLLPASVGAPSLHASKWPVCCFRRVSGRCSSTSIPAPTAKVAHDCRPIPACRRCTSTEFCGTMRTERCLRGRRTMGGRAHASPRGCGRWADPSSTSRPTAGRTPAGCLTHTHHMMHVRQPTQLPLSPRLRFLC